MINIHLDTDFGGDPDDFAALLMLLGLPEITVTGITTVLDNAGIRAGAATQILAAADRSEIPIIAGSKVSLSKADILGIREDFWNLVEPRPASYPGESVDGLERSLRNGSTLALIGPYTNAALFERVRSGMLMGRKVVHMGGFIQPAGEGYPQWSAPDDFNVQWDTRAAEDLYATGADITMVPMPIAMQAWITQSDVERISASGELGCKLATQMRRWSTDQQWTQIGQEHGAFPNDLAGIMWDPLTVLVACGWSGVEVVQMMLVPHVSEGVMTFVPDAERGVTVNVVTSVDTEAFRETFVSAIENAQMAVYS